LDDRAAVTGVGKSRKLKFEMRDGKPVLIKHGGLGKPKNRSP
jgi:hypothetical protein